MSAELSASDLEQLRLDLSTVGPAITIQDWRPGSDKPDPFSLDWHAKVARETEKARRLPHWVSLKYTLRKLLSEGPYLDNRSVAIKAFRSLKENLNTSSKLQIIIGSIFLSHNRESVEQLIVDLEADFSAARIKASSKSVIELPDRWNQLVTAVMGQLKSPMDPSPKESEARPANMNFKQARALLASRPGAVLTRDSQGNFIVKAKDSKR